MKVCFSSAMIPPPLQKGFKKFHSQIYLGNNRVLHSLLELPSALWDIQGAEKSGSEKASIKYFKLRLSSSRVYSQPSH